MLDSILPNNDLSNFICAQPDRLSAVLEGKKLPLFPPLGMKGINQNELLNQDMKIHYCDVCTWLALMLDMGYVEKMVFCLKNYSDLLWEYIFLNVSSFRKDFLASSILPINERKHVDQRYHSTIAQNILLVFGSTHSLNSRYI